MVIVPTEYWQWPLPDLYDQETKYILTKFFFSYSLLFDKKKIQFNPKY